MKLSDKQLIGVGLVASALLLLWRRRQQAVSQPQTDPEAFGWGYFYKPEQNTGSGGLIQTGITYYG